MMGSADTVGVWMSGTISAELIFYGIKAFTGYLRWGLSHLFSCCAICHAYDFYTSACVGAYCAVEVVYGIDGVSVVGGGVCDACRIDGLDVVEVAPGYGGFVSF